MAPVLELRGDALRAFLTALGSPRDDVHVLRVADDGRYGVKFKVNEGLWSSGYGSAPAEVAAGPAPLGPARPVQDVHLPDAP